MTSTHRNEKASVTDMTSTRAPERSRTFFALAALVVALSGCAARQTVALRDDGAITKDVRERLAADPASRDATIAVETKAGVVSLSGAVATDTIRTSAEQTAHDTPGVTAVDNNLRFGGAASGTN